MQVCMPGHQSGAHLAGCVCVGVWPWQRVQAMNKNGMFWRATDYQSANSWHSGGLAIISRYTQPLSLLHTHNLLSQLYMNSYALTQTHTARYTFACVRVSGWECVCVRVCMCVCVLTVLLLFSLFGTCHIKILAILPISERVGCVRPHMKNERCETKHIHLK